MTTSSSPAPVGLVFLPMSDPTWTQFTAFYASRARDRGGPAHVPPRPASGCFVGTAELDLIAGICLYETEGPYVIAEHFTTNPSPAVSLRARHEAAHLVMGQMTVYAAAVGKHLLVFPRAKSSVRILRRGGFQVHQVTCMSHGPWALAPTQKAAPAPGGIRHEGHPSVRSGKDAKPSDARKGKATKK